MASASKDPVRPRRLVRLGTVLPTVALAVASVVVAVTAVAGSHSAGPAPKPKPVSYADGAPIARLTSLYQTPGGARAHGWAFDPNSPSAVLSVFSSVDGKYTNSVAASLPRADFTKAYPGVRGTHGFAIQVPVLEGAHRVCILAKNIGLGKNVTLGCLSKTFDYGPFGGIDTVGTNPGSLHVKGWAVDADRVAAPVTIVVRVDGVAHTITADRSRPDISTLPAGAGPYHGYEAAIRASQGKHTVCITGKNIGTGSDNSLGCRTVTLNDSPIAKIDTAAQSAGTLRVRGWALDNDRPTTALRVSIRVDALPARIITANLARTDVAAAYPKAGRYHGFDQRFSLAEGAHRVCVNVSNIGFGSNTALPCRTVTLNFTPRASLTTLTATSTGVSLSGWASDPDTAAPVTVTIKIDGRTTKTLSANGAGTTHNGHNFRASLPTRSGPHTVCAIAANLLYGHANSAPSCRTITLVLRPIGRFESVKRYGTTNNLLLTGWAFDPDTTAATYVTATVDGGTAVTLRAAGYRADVATAYPSAGAFHGFSGVVTATDGEHRVCLVAKSVGAGADVSLGCRTINAVHPIAPSAPRSVTASAGNSSATVRWTAPASDGGAPWTKFVVTASPGARSITVGAITRSATITGLAASSAYTFSVRATNVAGTSAPGTSARIVTLSGLALQRTPAPISTSRYIRNIRGSSATEQALLRSEGTADAKANPAGHRYLILLDIGGQNQYYNGVVLSATTRFVTYADLVRDVKAYIDGYHSAQRATAPIVIAIGTNNDMDVNATTGRAWATAVVNPLVSYAGKYSGITVAGANDVEPGFSASYSATRNWLSGYLAATSAKFIFNGSADGCAWTVTNRGCNNGWTMSGLYNLSAGAAPTRVVNLPQIYNNTMADQWKFISLTGIGQGSPRINFGGPLTEYTACAQAGSCGSLGGNSAWQRLWNNLQSHPALKVPSLPYSTDLRIDR